MTTTTVPRTSAPAAAAAAVTGAVTLALLVMFALQSQQGQQWDQSAMNTVTAGRDTRLTVLSLLGYVGIGSIVAVVVGCVVISLLRGRIALAAGAVVVIAGANITTQLLKHQVFDRPDLGLGTLNSLPSGHTTVVASAVGAALLVAPGVSRPLIGLVGGFATTLTGASTIVAGWHRPSDVVAALAVSLVWTAGVAWLLRGRPQSGTGSALGAFLGSAGALFFLVSVGVRPMLGWDGFVDAALVLGGVSAATAVFVAAAAKAAPRD